MYEKCSINKVDLIFDLILPAYRIDEFPSRPRFYYANQFVHEKTKVESQLNQEMKEAIE